MLEELHEDPQEFDVALKVLRPAGHTHEPVRVVEFQKNCKLPLQLHAVEFKGVPVELAMLQEKHTPEINKLVAVLQLFVFEQLLETEFHVLPVVH
jgi:hypothetical protein